MIEVTISECIKALSALDQDRALPFPVVEGSWRGDYSELALWPGYRGGAKTVGELRAILEKSIGQTYTGYKGGEYVMHESTPIHFEAGHSTYGQWQPMAPVLSIILEGFAALEVGK